MAANEYLDRAEQFTLTMPTNGGSASPANPDYVLSPHAPDPLGNIGSGDEVTIHAIAERVTILCG